jgi:hypothetical protein
MERWNAQDANGIDRPLRAMAMGKEWILLS